MIKVRMKLSGITGMFKKLLPFGDAGEEQKFGTEQLDKMKERIGEARKILSDPKKTEYNIVTIAENMAIFESERTVKVLKDYSIPISSIVVNQLIPDNKGCPFCMAKRKVQQERLDDIEKRFSDYEIKQIPLFKEEVNGFEMLEKMGKFLN